MKLLHHTGKNFGDALNPLVFERLLPGFFDDDDREVFIGIGSIIGLAKPTPRTTRRIYFSSGFAAGAPGTYGKLPVISPADDIVCVRGPLTARAWGIPPEKAVVDGAMLVGRLLDVRPSGRRMPYTYMPHVGSFSFFKDWKTLLEDLGIELIDPADDPMTVLQAIKDSEVVIAEAMHGAIVADALGVPWVPAALYDTINAFKWQDFTASVGLPYRPFRAGPLFDERFYGPLIRQRLARYGMGALFSPAKWAYGGYRKHVVERKVVRAFRKMKEVRPWLSDRGALNGHLDKLTELAAGVRSRYARRGQ